MSQKNVEIVRQSMEAFDRRERSVWLALHDEDFEIVTTGDWPESDAGHGPEAAWEFYISIANAFDQGELGDVDLVDAGDKVLVRQNNRLRGKTSGIGVALDFWVVVTILDGKMLRDHWFTDRAEALEAAGLSE